MRFTIVWVILLLILPLATIGQDGFIWSKAKIKTRDNNPYIRFIKIVNKDRKDNIFLKNNTPQSDTLSIWEAFPEPGGSIEFSDNHQVYGVAQLGQLYMEIDKIEVDSGENQVLRLTTRTDTAYFSIYNPSVKNPRRYSYKLFRRFPQIPRPSGEPFEVNLVIFRQTKPGEPVLSIKDTGKMSDYPAEFRLVATLLAMKSLVQALSS